MEAAEQVEQMSMELLSPLLMAVQKVVVPLATTRPLTRSPQTEPLIPVLAAEQVCQM
jgi:hypothetical protein